MLINNAGFGAYGHFTELDPQRDHVQVMVNMSSVVDLTYAFLPAMVERQEGAIINVSSLAAFQSFPYMAVYPASKAFVLSLSEALTTEYVEHGVRVIALCPGEVKTNFAKISGAPSPLLSIFRLDALSIFILWGTPSLRLCCTQVAPLSGVLARATSRIDSIKPTSFSSS